MSRRNRRKKSESVELNLAAMLDMAFQLLTFFILTFRPAPIEGQLGLHLPPPVALTNVQAKQESPDGGGQGEQNDIETLDLTINADDRGEVTMIKAGFRPIVKGRLSPPNIEALNQQLKTMFSAQAVPLDRVQLVVDERLRYEELMKVVDTCTQQKLQNGEFLQRISFIEMKGSAK